MSCPKENNGEDNVKYNSKEWQKGLGDHFPLVIYLTRRRQSNVSPLICHVSRDPSTSINMCWVSDCGFKPQLDGHCGAHLSLHVCVFVCVCVPACLHHINFQCLLLINVKATWEMASGSLFVHTPTCRDDTRRCSTVNSGHTGAAKMSVGVEQSRWKVGRHYAAGDVMLKTCAAKWNNTRLSMNEQTNV